MHYLEGETFFLFSVQQHLQGFSWQLGVGHHISLFCVLTNVNRFFPLRVVVEIFLQLFTGDKIQNLKLRLLEDFKPEFHIKR